MRQDGPMARRDAPLPTGLVTFLLTDIEGSTQAWQTAPDEMTAIVSRHYQILDAAVATRGGVRPQEQGEGDSIVAVFVDPIAAVTTALEAQLALRRELPDLPVRMALHTGETMLRNEDNYVGLTIIRCARIRSSGHGGQILLSDETTQRPSTVRSPTTADVIDLGLYGLRGLDGRARVWQLTHPELPTDFPPLKAGTSAAGNLPSPITSFIGRRTELTTVGNSLDAGAAHHPDRRGRRRQEPSRPGRRRRRRQRDDRRRVVDPRGWGARRHRSGRRRRHPGLRARSSRRRPARHGHRTLPFHRRLARDLRRLRGRPAGDRRRHRPAPHTMPRRTCARHGSRVTPAPRRDRASSRTDVGSRTPTSAASTTSTSSQGLGSSSSVV